MAHNCSVICTTAPTQVSRRTALAVGGSLGLSTVLSACGLLVDEPVAVAAHIWVGYEPMFMARDLGWLEASRVHLQQTRTAGESIALLRFGKVQAAALTLDETLSARASGLPLSVVMVFNVSMGADLLLAQPRFKRLADLKGMRIGYEASSVGEVMLFEVLKAANLSRSDVSLVNMEVDHQVDAWKRKFLDAVITYEPVAAQLFALGAVPLFDSRQIPDVIVDVLAVRSDALDHAHRNALRYLVAAHLRALDHLLRNPQDCAYRMAAHLGLPASDVLTAYKGLILPDVSHNYRLLAGPPPELLATARRVSDILVGIGTLSKPDSLVDLVWADLLPTQA